MPITKIPTKQRIKIPPYSTARIKATVIMAFLLRENLSAVWSDGWLSIVSSSGFRICFPRLLVVMGLV